jgi:hypothetical protein
MSKRTPTYTETLALRARAVDREIRKENDPWFGRRRKSGEMAGLTKANASKRACRDRKDWT